MTVYRFFFFTTVSSIGLIFAMLYPGMLWLQSTWTDEMVRFEREGAIGHSLISRVSWLRSRSSYTTACNSVSYWSAGVTEWHDNKQDSYTPCILFDWHMLRHQLLSAEELLVLQRGISLCIIQTLMAASTRSTSTTTRPDSSWTVPFLWVDFPIVTLYYAR